MDSSRRWQGHQLALAFRHQLALALLFLLLHTPLSAARVLVRTEVSPNPVQVGEPFQVIIQRIEDLNQQQARIQAPPLIFPDLPGLELLSSQINQNISDLNQSMRLIQTYTYTLVAQQAGEVQLPPLSLGEDQGHPLFSKSVKIHILPPPTRLPAWLPWLLLLALALTLTGLWLFWKKRLQIAPANQPSEPHPSVIAETAPPDLQSLRQELRRQLARSLPESAAGLTLAEMLAARVQQGLPVTLQAELQALIAELDSLRFQGLSPSKEKLESLSRQIQTLAKQLPPD